MLLPPTYCTKDAILRSQDKYAMIGALSLVAITPERSFFNRGSITTISWIVLLLYSMYSGCVSIESPMEVSQLMGVPAIESRRYGNDFEYPTFANRYVQLRNVEVEVCRG